jgi:hypothetical protein
MKDNTIFDPLDSYIEEIQHRKSRAYYPSSASCKVNGKVVGQCLRKQFFQRTGEKGKPDTYRLYLTQQLGKAFEIAFLRGYKAKGLLKGDDVPFKVWVCGLEISGRLDGLTKLDEIIECKSAYGKAFFYAIGKKPNPEHLCQIMVYLACLGKKVALLPYGSRDDTAKRQGYRLTKADIEREGILFSRIIQRWKTLEACIKANEWPDRDFNYEDWQCGYCAYRKKCYRSPGDLEVVDDCKPTESS